ALAGFELDDAAELVVAYEPVWAIGTGLTATAADAQEMSAFIRSVLRERFGAVGAGVRVLYGGSMKPSNAAELLAKPDIDGGLIGGASLDVADLRAIAAAAWAGRRSRHGTTRELHVTRRPSCSTVCALTSASRASTPCSSPSPPTSATSPTS